MEKGEKERSCRLTWASRFASTRYRSRVNTIGAISTASPFDVICSSIRVGPRALLSHEHERARATAILETSETSAHFQTVYALTGLNKDYQEMDRYREAPSDPAKSHEPYFAGRMSRGKFTTTRRKKKKQKKLFGVAAIKPARSIVVLRDLRVSSGFPRDLRARYPRQFRRQGRRERVRELPRRGEFVWYRVIGFGFAASV